MTELKLRVSGLYRPGEHVYPSGPLPLVQLVGSWLERAGFPVGTRVRVDVIEDGRLVLSRVDEAEEESVSCLAAWEPAGAVAPSIDPTGEHREPAELAGVAHGTA